MAGSTGAGSPPRTARDSMGPVAGPNAQNGTGRVAKGACKNCVRFSDTGKWYVQRIGHGLRSVGHVMDSHYESLESYESCSEFFVCN